MVFLQKFNFNFVNKNFGFLIFEIMKQPLKIKRVKKCRGNHKLITSALFDSILCMVLYNLGVYAPPVKRSSNHYSKGSVRLAMIEQPSDNTFCPIFRHFRETE